MKITTVYHSDHIQVTVLKPDGYVSDCWVFKTKAEVEAFIYGFRSAQRLANYLIQSIPTESDSIIHADKV
jgi:C1A family cysteine protease